MTRRPDGWISGQIGVRTGWFDRPDGWQGTWISSDLQTLNSGTPVYSIFTLKWFCSNTEWGQNTNRYIILGGIMNWVVLLFFGSFLVSIWWCDLVLKSGYGSVLFSHFTARIFLHLATSSCKKYIARNVYWFGVEIRLWLCPVLPLYC
jgi:hypothetical protein